MLILSPVVTQDELIEGIEAGKQLKILCVEAPVAKTGSWAGRWVIYLLNSSPNELPEQLLVKTRGVKSRDFRTSYGLLSFAKELGVTVPSVPMEQGGVGYWKKEVENPLEVTEL